MARADLQGLNKQQYSEKLRMRIKQPEFLTNRIIGAVVMLIAIAFSFVVLSYTLEIKNFNNYLHQGCPLPDNVCPYKTTLPSTSVYGFTLAVVLFFVGLILMLFEPEKKEAKAKQNEAVKTLNGEEKTVYQMLIDSGGVMFQSELVEKSGLPKVKVSRLLDRLEGKGLIERKRRGMSNAVVLKH